MDRSLFVGIGGGHGATEWRPAALEDSRQIDDLPKYIEAMRLTTRQWERTIENINTLGLAALTGGVADAILVKDQARISFDLAGVALGLALMVAAVWLTKKLNGGKV